METNFEKYLEARFTNIDQRFAHIENTMGELRSDLRETRSEISGLKTWIVGTAIALAMLFFAVVGYHTMVMQSQMQVFSEYIKAVTQPAPKPSSQK